MTRFVGTRRLARLAFRRDCVMLPVCVFGIAALLAITARDLRALYPTAASRLAVATRAGENPALRFLLGRLNGTSVGAGLLLVAAGLSAGLGNSGGGLTVSYDSEQSERRGPCPKG